MNLEKERKQLLESKFLGLFGGGGEISLFHAPGRVNLIGEHTDYNGGYVFPCALSLGTVGAVRKRTDGVYKFASTSSGAGYPLVEVKDGNIQYQEEYNWGNYLLGVVDQFLKLGFPLTGLEILIDGNIPERSGLSSSASIEMLMAVSINSLYQCQLSMVDMVKLTQQAENQFVSVNCGIMDQYAVGMGKKNNAIFLDCKKVQHEYAPFILQSTKIVISNTNKQRGLADSKYNERRSECERAVFYLRQKLDIEYLGDIDVEIFESNKNLIADPVILKRATHVVYENERVKQAVQRLKENDIHAFGVLMNQSHESLRDLYEVTGFELDTMVEEAWKIDGVIGSRMTGAGFGGCTVSLIKDDAIDEYTRKVTENYRAKTGLNPDIYIAEVGDGAGQIF